MTIAVHIAVPEIQNDLSANFNYKCFIILAANFPDNHYIFIFDKPLLSCSHYRKKYYTCTCRPTNKEQVDAILFLQL